MKKLLVYSLVIIIFSFLFIHLRNNWDVIYQIQWGAHPIYLLLHFVLMFGVFFIFVSGWKYLMSIHDVNLPLRVIANNWLVSNLGKYIPGKLFMIAGRVELAHKFGVRRLVSFNAFVIENALMVFAAIPFLLLSLLNGFNIFNNQTYIIAFIVFFISLVVFAKPQWIIWFLSFLCEKFRHEPITTELKFRNMLSLFAIYFTGWLLYGVAGMFLAYALIVPESVSSIKLIVSFVASWVIGYLSFLTPGGLGVRELVLVGLLAPDIPNAHAITLALIARLTWTVVELSGALIGLTLKFKQI
ncbi:MAG: lysylphosphatidylglycerol synthase domain-containing protein [Desulfobulbaceae bacterium]|nr:lysylphosphatidylglycerol synthase domain-containing protein [Desulfobulbaceae bacterium]